MESSIESFLKCAIEESEDILKRVEDFINYVLHNFAESADLYTAPQNIPPDDDGTSSTTTASINEPPALSLPPTLLHVLFSLHQSQILSFLRHPTPHLRDLSERLIMMKKCIPQYKRQVSTSVDLVT